MAGAEGEGAVARNDARVTLGMVYLSLMGRRDPSEGAGREVGPGLPGFMTRPAAEIPE